MNINFGSIPYTWRWSVTISPGSWSRNSSVGGHHRQVDHVVGISCIFAQTKPACSRSMTVVDSCWCLLWGARRLRCKDGRVVIFRVKLKTNEKDRSLSLFRDGPTEQLRLWAFLHWSKTDIKQSTSQVPTIALPGKLRNFHLRALFWCFCSIEPCYLPWPPSVEAPPMVWFVGIVGSFVGRC